MEIARSRVMAASEKIRANDKTDKLKTKLSTNFLSRIASYIISDNLKIRTKGYRNIQELYNVIDKSTYANNIDKNLLEFINRGLQCRLEYKLQDKSDIIDYITSHGNDIELVRNINMRDDIGNNMVDYIDSEVTSLLNSLEFEKQMNEFSALEHEMNSNADRFYERKKTMDKWNKLIHDTSNQIRNHTIEKKETEPLFLSDMEDYARESYQEMTSNRYKLRTGIQYLNNLLGGGFENNRCYCIFGLQGEGKSITLLDLALQIKKYNKTYRPKDPTKIPCVVYLTLENSKRETFTRMFVQLTDGFNDKTKQFTDYSMHDAISMLKKSTEVNEKDPIDLVIKQEDADSIDTSYLYDLYEYLMDKGREPICIIVDYLNLIRSVRNYSVSEERHKLGAVVKEMKTAAKTLDIPMITASQFNRGANTKIDEARNNNTTLNLVKLLGRDNIGESIQILNNIDGAFMIVPEMHEENGYIVKYLGITLAKARYFPNTAPMNGSRTIHHPYTRVDSIKLVEDVGIRKSSKSKLELLVGEMNVNEPDRYKEDIIPQSSKLREVEAPEEKEEPAIIRQHLDRRRTIMQYNPDWRNQPSRIQGMINVDGLCPEQQLRIILRRKHGGERPVPQIEGAPSRYSDLYTKLYDLDGSKEERIVRDFNLRYSGMNFTEKDFSKLYHKVLVEKEFGSIDGADGEFKLPAFFKCESPFVKITDPYEEERLLNESKIYQKLKRMRSLVV